jgi:hypothetical protein
MILGGFFICWVLQMKELYILLDELIDLASLVGDTGSGQGCEYESTILYCVYFTSD